MENYPVNQNQPERGLRRKSKLGLVGMVASAVLGATLTYSAVTSHYERKIYEIQHHAVFERVELYLNEWRNRAYRDKQVNREELARQYGIRLTEEGRIDYQALQNTMFPPEE